MNLLLTYPRFLSDFNRVAVFVVFLISCLSTTNATTLFTYAPSNTTANSSLWQLGGALGFVGANSQLGYIDKSVPYSPTVSGQYGLGGAQFGFLFTDTPSGSYSVSTPQRTAVVSNFTITGDFGGGRAGLKDITLYYGDNQSMNITLPATTGTQTYTFGTPIETSYLYWTAAANSFYTNGSFGNDNNIGLKSFSVDGTWGDVMTNVNATATISAAGGTAGSLNDLTNGIVFTANNWAQFFGRDATTNSMTATYSSAQTIDSFGLGLTIQGDRAQPAFVQVRYDGGSEIINLRGSTSELNLSYNVYNLATTVNTTFLEISFPLDSTSGGWYTTGTDSNYGITEFQAFTATILPIPEPRTLWSLLFLSLTGIFYLRHSRKSLLFRARSN